MRAKRAFGPRKEREAMAQHAQGFLRLRSGFRQRAQTPAKRLNLDRQKRAARDDNSFLYIFMFLLLNLLSVEE